MPTGHTTDPIGICPNGFDRAIQDEPLDTPPRG
jgi:hypothetical protein